MPLCENYLPGQGFNFSGGVLNQLPGGNLPTTDWIRMRQPFLDSRGRACVSIHDVRGGYTRNDSHGGEPKPLLRTYLVNDLRNMGMNVPMVSNAASLGLRQWAELDATIVRAARQRLRATEDLRAAGTYGGFNGMGRMTLEYQAASDPGEAVVDMDAHTDARNDAPLMILRSLPLPITHSDFGFSQRELLVSRNAGGLPLDTFMAEAAGRRVAESIEDQVIGNVTGVTYGTQTAGYGTHTGTSTVYGYTNFPQRLTKTNFTTPTTTNGPTTYAEILSALAQLTAQFHYGPFTLYHSTDWSPFMDSPFSTAGGNAPGETLRSMLLKNPDIADVRRLDRLTSTYTFIFVERDPATAQLVVGQDLQTVQWEEKGGLDLRFKVLAIMVPRLRSDYNSRTGILHGTTA
jgi:hypothetical protein